MIIFQNPGLIDLLGVEISGMSVKEHPNAIGKFGTGLKYAIAIILRVGDTITIYRGMKKVTFTKKTETFRGKEFDVVYQGRRRMPWTTQHGLNWEPWQAFRELWSNCHDEGGKVWAAEAFTPKDDTTTIIWDGKTADQVWKERDSVILRTEPMLVSNRIEVHAGDNTNCYYQGIRVLKLPRTSRFTYNFLDGVYLTEDRTMAHWHMMPARIATAVLQSSDPGFIEGVLTSSKAMIEGSLPWDAVKDVTPTQTFASVAMQLKEEDRLGDGAKGLFVSLGRKLRSYGIEDPTIVKMGPMALQVLAEAMAIVPGEIAAWAKARKSIVAKTGWRDHMLANYYRHGDTIAINASAIDAGVEETAKALIKAAALGHYGRTEDQLVHFILKGKFFDAEPDRWIDEDSGVEEE